jgi:predicted LPLAT superfamily acyltransferase
MNDTGSARHWAAMEETSLIWGIKTLVWVYRIFGRWAFRLFLVPVVSYYFLGGRLARNASLEYLRHLRQQFPELNIGDGWWASYRHFLSFGETLLDKVVAWMGCIDRSQVDFPNRPLLLEQHRQQRGGIIISGHIGNLELCQAMANLNEQIRLNILVHTKHAEKFNRLLGKTAASACLNFIQVTELNPAIAIELQDKIERGEFLVLVGDRIPVQGGRTVKANFLGEDAEFPQGPYLLASLLRCPVYTLFCYPSQGRFHIDLQPFADSIRIPRSEPQRQQQLESLARQFAQRLETLCHAMPLQWFNFYPYWQTPDNRKQPGDNAS